MQKKDNDDMGYGKGIRTHTHTHKTQTHTQTQNTDRKRKGNRLELALNKKENTSVLEHNIIQAYWQTRNSERASQ